MSLFVVGDEVYLTVSDVVDEPYSHIENSCKLLYPFLCQVHVKGIAIIQLRYDQLLH